MKKRILCVLMIVMLLCSSMAVTSFAETEEPPVDMPEAVVLVQVNNVECKMVEKMTDLTVDIKLKDGRDVISVPVERVEAEGYDTVALWLGYSFDEIDAAIKADMAEFQKDYHLGTYDEFMENLINTMFGVDDMTKDLVAIFDKYEIVINGIPEDSDHEFSIETNTFLITSTIVTELFDIAKGFVGELFELSKAETAKINNFSDIIEKLNDFLREYELLENGQDFYDLVIELSEGEDITKEELISAVEKMDEVLDYLRSEDYTGTVFAGIYLDCDCPFTVDFCIYHQYFKEVDGKMTLAGTANYGPIDLSETEGDEWFDYDFEKYIYEGLSGDVIKASDYIHTEFNGETYEYVGSYEDWTYLYPDEDWYFTDNYDFDTLDELYACEDWWTEYKVDEFTLGDEDIEAPTGLVLRYQLMETPDPVVETGDDSDMTPFYVVMMLALAVMAAAVVTRRRQMD